MATTLNFTGLTLSQCYDTLAAQIATQSILSGLTNSPDTFENLLADLNNDPSTVSIWRQFLFVQAYNEFLLSNNMQDFFTQMNELKNATGYGSLTWLIDAILLWQVDQIVQLDPVNFTFTYNPIDTSKCLVGYAAAQELFGGILVKVRGSQTDLLTTSQMASLTNYVNQVKISGQKILIQNLPSDKLGIYYTIYYNNQIEQTVVDGNVQQVITDFIQNLPFDGTLKISQLTAAILGVTGVQDAQFVSATGNGRGFTNSYNSAAGYMTIDGSYPLSSTLSYIQIQK